MHKHSDTNDIEYDMEEHLLWLGILCAAWCVTFIISIMPAYAQVNLSVLLFLFI